MRQLPAPLQQTLATLQVGQTTQPFGAENEGISVLVLCGRDMPQAAGAPSAEQIEQQLLDEKVNKRAQRYLRDLRRDRSEEHTSELQSLMRISYAVFCLKKKHQQ